MQAAVEGHDDLEAPTQSLSAFRYAPKSTQRGKKTEMYLSRLNSQPLERL
ncbi:MAG: hypothetical protein JRN09_07375 [Nitrososphaerota archaeon]|jgi:hypothetical protein|nr:hypothetical protein [Nitrososphaerota archaeon]